MLHAIGWSDLLKFQILAFGLLFLYQSLPGTFLETLLIHNLTVIPSSHLINLVDNGLEVNAIGKRLQSSEVTISILHGCEGFEVMILFWSGFVWMQMSTKMKIAGLFIGTGLIYIFNQIRIVSLFFLALHQSQWFELIHAYVSPLILIALISVFVWQWLNYSAKH